MEIIQYWARVPTPHTDPLWHRATALWAGITAQLPDLAPAVALQQRLIRLTLDATSALADTPLLALDRASILAKWQKGLPLLRNEVVPIPPAPQRHPSADLHCPGRRRGRRQRTAHRSGDCRWIYRRGFLAWRFARPQSEGDQDERLAHGILARSGLADRRAGQRTAGVPVVGWPEGQHYESHA